MRMPRCRTLCRLAVLVVALQPLSIGAQEDAPTPSPAPSSIAPQPQSAELTRSITENQTAQAEYYRRRANPGGSPPLQGLAPAVIAAAAGLLGSIGGLLFSTFLAERKSRQEAAHTYARHRLQLSLAVGDLIESLRRIPPEPAPLPPFLSEALVFQSPTRPAVPDRGDPYYLKYDLVDTVYRLCALFGWLELYRTDVTFLRGPPGAQRRRVEGYFAEIRQCLADATLKAKAADAAGWRDGFILEDDQRAIGERMLDRKRSDVLGYAAFCADRFRQPLDRNDPTAIQDWWVWNATRFIVELDPALGPTFARRRLALLRSNLEALAASIAPETPA